MEDGCGVEPFREGGVTGWGGGDLVGLLKGGYLKTWRCSYGWAFRKSS